MRSGRFLIVVVCQGIASACSSANVGPDGGHDASVTPQTDASALDAQADTREASVSSEPSDPSEPIDVGTCKGALGAATCNPVNGAGCAAGQACDITSSTRSFSCFSAGAQGLCETCDRDACKAGFGCADVCIRYCCTDSDCPKGTCKLGVLDAFPKLGLCVDEAMSVCGGGDGGVTP